VPAHITQLLPGPTVFQPDDGNSIFLPNAQNTSHFNTVPTPESKIKANIELPFKLQISICPLDS
jgi:hypothetical protein